MSNKKRKRGKIPKVEIIKANNLITEEINTDKKLKKVCAYARVSTDSEEQLTSYSSQIKYYTEKIKSNSDWKFVVIYADEKITGTQIKNRCEFQRMIDDALNDKIDIIIAKSISGFARNAVDTLNNVRLLREHNVDVFFEKEKEISNKIKMLNKQIEQLEYKDKQNKDISKRLKDIEKVINEEEQPMEIFDDIKFENLV